jgi:hypothetical protein
MHWGGARVIGVWWTGCVTVTTLGVIRYPYNASVEVSGSASHIRYLGATRVVGSRSPQADQ